MFVYLGFLLTGIYVIGHDGTFYGVAYSRPKVPFSMQHHHHFLSRLAKSAPAQLLLERPQGGSSDLSRGFSNARRFGFGIHWQYTVGLSGNSFAPRRELACRCKAQQPCVQPSEWVHLRPSLPVICPWERSAKLSVNASELRLGLPQENRVPGELFLTSEKWTYSDVRTAFDHYSNA